MPCKTINLGDGVAIVCTHGRSKPRPCSVCGRPSAKLCDHPIVGGTCDKPLCDQCAVPMGKNRDWCPSHKPHTPPKVK